MRRRAALTVAALLAASGAGAQTEPAALAPVSFAELAGWADDDHGAAFRTFLLSCRALQGAAPPLRAGRDAVPALLAACARAATLYDPTPASARAFFEAAFRPVRVGRGRLTGYYEPEIAGALAPHGVFDAPLLAKPDDVATIPPGETRRGVPEGFAAARAIDGRFEPYPTRAAIEDGALTGRGLELVYVERVDAFFVHVQGSSRVRLPDGTRLRIAYAGRNGRPFTAIGRLLVEQGAMTREQATMASIRAWLGAHPDEGRALMRRNESFVFFRIDESLAETDGPRGAQDVPVTAGRSLAIDRTIWPYGLPVWIDGRFPSGSGGEPLRRLMIAQDTGSAIVGVARGDFFAGTGDAAGALAGAMREEANFVVLLPRAIEELVK